MQACCYVLVFRNGNETRKYIGHTGKPFEKRLAQHLSLLKNGRHANKVLQKFYSAGGTYDGKPEIYPCLSKNIAYNLEMNLIDQYSGDPDVVNVELRFDTYSRNPNKDQIAERVTQSLKNYFEGMTEDEKFAFYSKPGISNGMYGRSHSNETRLKISEKAKEWNRTNVSPNLGKKRSDETRAKISKVASLRLGTKNHFFGKSHREETKLLLSEKNKGKLPPNIRAVEIVGIKYPTITEAGRQLGLATSVVLWRIKSVNPKFSQWKWL